MRRTPNGYGSVTRLPGHRDRPWAARVSITAADGSVHRRYIGYAKTREEALMMLSDYKRQPWQVNRETLTFADLYQHWLQEKGPGLSKPSPQLRWNLTVNPSSSPRYSTLQPALFLSIWSSSTAHPRNELYPEFFPLPSNFCLFSSDPDTPLLLPRAKTHPAGQMITAA